MIAAIVPSTAEIAQPSMSIRPSGTPMSWLDSRFDGDGAIAEAELGLLEEEPQDRDDEGERDPDADRAVADGEAGRALREHELIVGEVRERRERA